MNKFCFWSTWSCPHIILLISAGELEQQKVTLIITDDYIVCGNLLIGFPIFQHLKFNTRKLLEKNRNTLDGADYSDVSFLSSDHTARSVGRLMIARMNRVYNREVTFKATIEDSCPRVNYYERI